MRKNILTNFIKLSLPVDESDEVIFDVIAVLRLACNGGRVVRLG